jgi:hypothetical protein
MVNSHFQPLRVSGVKKLEDAMVLMELSPGANVRKGEVGMENVATMMTRAHAIRCPGDEFQQFL